MKGQLINYDSIAESIVCANCSSNLKFNEKSFVCENCGKQFEIGSGKYFFIESAISPTDRSKSFSKEKWTPLRRANYDFYKRELADCKAGLVLDIGAGPGQLRELLPLNSKIIGADFIAYEKTVDVVCDLNKGLPFKENHFDIAFASNVLEHLSDPQKVVNDSHRILKPGGKFFGSVPFLLMEHQAPYDFFRYTRFAILKMFEGAGFSEIRIIPLGRPVEVLETTGRHFLKSIVDAFEEEGKISFVKKIRLKLCSIVFSIALWIEKLIVSSQKERMNFTLGYGIVATKK